MVSTTRDVVVIGGGIIGTSIAYALARRGVRNLLLLEPRSLASGPPVGSFGIARAYHPDRVMVTLARRSLRVYEHFAEEVGGTAGFIRAGLLILVPEGEQEALAAHVQLATRLGGDVQLLPTSEAVRAVEPRVSLSGVAGAAYEPGAGYGDPVKASASFAMRARDLGVQVRQGIRVLAIHTAGDEGGRHITGVLTDGGYVTTRCVVNAGGPMGNTISEMVGVELPVTSYRYLGVVLRHPPTFGDHHPITLDIVGGTVMRPDGPQLTLMGPLRAIAEDDLPANRDDPPVDQSAAPEYQKLLRRRYPTLATATVRAAWATSHDVTPDWHPIIGPVMGLDGFCCAVGMGGYSFALAPAVGELVARLITDDANRGAVQLKRAQDLDPKSHAYFFRPDRFGARERIVHPHAPSVGGG